MGKERLIKIDSGELRIGEPIIMMLSNFCQTENLFDNIEIDKIYRADNSLIIENPTAELLVYFQKWISLIRDPRTGECMYPSILNIRRNKVFECMIIRNNTTNKVFVCLPSKVSHGNTTKLEFTIIYYKE